MNYMYLIFISDQFLILEVLKQPLFDDSMVDSECPTLCDTYIFFVSMQAWIREEGINFCFVKTLRWIFFGDKSNTCSRNFQLEEEKIQICKKKFEKNCQIVYILFIACLNHTPVNRLLHCTFCFFFCPPIKSRYNHLRNQFDIIWIISHEISVHDHEFFY